MKFHRPKFNAQLAGFYRSAPKAQTPYRRRRARIDDYIGSLAVLDGALDLAHADATERGRTNPAPSARNLNS